MKALIATVCAALGLVTAGSAAMTEEALPRGGVAVLVEGTSDNRNRTVSEIRHVFNKHGGNLGTAGCVAYLFQPRGYVAVAREKISEDDLMGLVLDAGADDIQASDSVWEVFTAPGELDGVVQAVKGAGLEPEESVVGKYAETHVALEGPKAQQMLKLLDALEDNDDVQNVWSNVDIPDKELEAAAG